MRTTNRPIVHKRECDGWCFELARSTCQRVNVSTLLQTPLLSSSLMPNQWKPCRESFNVFITCKSHRISCHVAPIELVENYIRQFHLQGVSLKKMLPMLSKHYDTETYGLGCVLYSPPPLFTPLTHLSWVSRMSKLNVYVKTLGLTSARSQGHTFNTIAGPIAELRDMYPGAGAAELRTNLWNKFEMRVSK